MRHYRPRSLMKLAIYAGFLFSFDSQRKFGTAAAFYYLRLTLLLAGALRVARLPGGSLFLTVGRAHEASARPSTTARASGSPSPACSTSGPT